MAAFAIGLSGCAQIFTVDFNDSQYVAGADPAGGTPGDPNGDAISTWGAVTVSTNTGAGLGKHIRLNATATQDAFADFTPIQSPADDNYMVSFRGSKQSNQPSATFVMVYGRDAMANEVYICSFAVAASDFGKNGAWAALYYHDDKGDLYTSRFDESAIRLDAPHHVHIRLDRANKRIIASIGTEAPNGTMVEDSLWVPSRDFSSLTRVHAFAERGADTDYRIENMHMSTWSASAQSRVVDTARRYGLLHSRFGQPATPDEELTLLEEAFAASPATLRRWLPRTTIDIIDKIRP